MIDLDELGGCIRLIATRVSNQVRAVPGRPELAGWGQFVDAVHVHQIGPYGTYAALLTISIGNPGHTFDRRVMKQAEEFWTLRESRLFEQNVRLAFLVLSLARIQQDSLQQVCTEVANELRSRQLADGSWGDWRDTAQLPAVGRPEATAWVVLALGRLSSTDPAAIKGAQYLATQMTGMNQPQLLSPIAVAAAISVLPRKQQNAALRRRARHLVQNMQVGQEENISFFDYMQSDTRLARDYLCFPAFFPFSVLVKGVLRDCSFVELPMLASARIRLTARLYAVIDAGQFYRLPGAQFSATVDQAMVALTFEQLRESTTKIDGLVGRMLPIWRGVSSNFFIRVVAPLIIVAGSIVTLQSPSAIPRSIQQLTGKPMDNWIKLADKNASSIQLAVAFVLAVFPQLPKSAFVFLKRKIWG
jgi:hypothetical protein